MTPAAGAQTEPRGQTEPGYVEPVRSEERRDMDQPGMQGEPGMEGEPGMQGQPGSGQYGEPGVPRGMGDQPGMEGTSPGMEGTGVGQPGADMLAEARCRREERCNQVGADKRYASREDCQSALRPESEQALSSCGGAVNRDALNACLAAIDSQSCDTVKESLSDYEQCRSTMLCAP